MAAPQQAVVLLTSTPKDSATEASQRTMLQQLEANGVAVTTIDGANAENKDVRAQLWALPGAKRAVYPQFFTKDAASGAFSFVADPIEWEKLVECNDIDHRLDELLKTLAKK